MRKRIILFICKGNSGRSQMAESLLNRFSKRNKGQSAGIKPDDKIHPWTKQLMEELGIDIRRKKTKLLNHRLLRKADRIIILDLDVAKNIPKEYSLKLEKWEIKKLKGKAIGQVRKIRDQLKKRIKTLIKNEEKE